MPAPISQIGSTIAPPDEVGRAPSAPSAPSQASGQGGQKFGDMLTGALRQMNDAQTRGDELVQKFAFGEPVDIHQMMLALNEASNALQLALQVRSKVLEAYSDLMHTPL